MFSPDLPGSVWEATDFPPGDIPYGGGVKLPVEGPGQAGSSYGGAFVCSHISVTPIFHVKDNACYTV